MQVILEGIVTTVNSEGQVNIAPMGPLVESSMEAFVLRPFQTSQSFRNLQISGHGVLHVVDNVELLARAAIDCWDEPPQLEQHPSVDGQILVDCCRWYAFTVRQLDDSSERATIHCEVIEQGRKKDFWGFNRARHAVLEAAILATRVQLLPAEDIRSQMQQLASPVEKTGGDAEHRAFAMLERYIDASLAPPE
jgi:hypothetical protein